MKKGKRSFEKLKELAYRFKPRILFVAMDKKYNLYYYTNDKRLRHLNLKKTISKTKELHPLLDMRIFKEKIKIINNNICWDLSGEGEDQKYLILDPYEIFSAPVLEESIEKVLHWGKRMNRFRNEKSKTSDQMI